MWSPFYRWDNRGSERVSYLPKLTKVESRRAKHWKSNSLSLQNQHSYCVSNTSSTTETALYKCTLFSTGNIFIWPNPLRNKTFWKMFPLLRFQHEWTTWEKLRYPEISRSRVGSIEQGGICSCWELWAWLLKCWARTLSFKIQIPGSLMPLAFKAKQPCWEAERGSETAPFISFRKKGKQAMLLGSCKPKRPRWFLEPAALTTRTTTLRINGKWDAKWILKSEQ